MITVKVYETENLSTEEKEMVMKEITPTKDMLNFRWYAEKKVTELPNNQRVSFNYHPKTKLNVDNAEVKEFKAYVIKFARNFGFDEVTFDYDTNTVILTDTYTHAVEETKMVEEFAKAGVQVTII